MNMVNHSGLKAFKVAMYLRGTSATEIQWHRDSDEVKNGPFVSVTVLNPSQVYTQVLISVFSNSIS